MANKKLQCRITEAEIIASGLNQFGNDVLKTLAGFGWEPDAEVWRKKLVFDGESIVISMVPIQHNLFHSDVSVYAMTDQWEEEEIQGYIDEWKTAFDTACEWIEKLGYSFEKTESFPPDNEIWGELSRAKYRRNLLSVWVIQNESMHYVPTVQLAFEFHVDEGKHE